MPRWWHSDIRTQIVTKNTKASLYCWLNCKFATFIFFGITFWHLLTSTCCISKNCCFRQIKNSGRRKMQSLARIENCSFFTTKTWQLVYKPTNFPLTFLVKKIIWVLLCEIWVISFVLLIINLELGSHLPARLFYLLQWKPFKNDEKCSYFMVKALFILKIFKFLC